jgi:hypothetical protein
MLCIKVTVTKYKIATASFTRKFKYAILGGIRMATEMYY